MMLTEDIHYVGVNDRRKHRFEGLWPLPAGVSYNSYLVTDQKVALIDTVDACFFETFLRKVRAVLGNRSIDYLVINHMEPDHSGSISLLRHYYPNLQVVGNKKTLEMLAGYYGCQGPEPLCVAEGSTLELGKHRLRFHLIPMVHWPETMVSYDETNGVLFSGDAFGCFGALNGGVTDTTINVSAYWSEMERYYSNIVGKYGVPVQRALKKLEGLDLRMICSTHGPVWTEQIPAVVATYDRLSRYEGEPGVVVAYGSMYGNTEQMAETIAEELSLKGVRNIVMHDLSRSHLSYVLADIFRYNGLVLGAPTYNNGIYPPMKALLEALANRELKNRTVGVFGSFSWAGKAACTLECFATGQAGFKTIGPAVEMKQGFGDEAEQNCRALGQQMAEAILA